MLKKILVLAMLAWLLSSYSFVSAEYETVKDANGWYNEVKLSNDMEFRVKYDHWVVYMDWSEYDMDEKFKYYKIVRSTKNPNLAYPNDGYIKYSSDTSFTEYTDKNPPVGTVYYRVCSLTHENNRYCSNIEKVFIEKNNYINTTSDKVSCTMDYSPVCWKTKEGEYKTFSNKCTLNSARAYYKYAGECKDNAGEIDKPKDPVACTMEYAPVCWKTKEGEYKTFSNKCMLKASHAYYKYTWECKDDNNKHEDKKEIKEEFKHNNPYASKISSSLRNKSDKVIAWFISRLDKANLSNEVKAEKIDKIIERLNTLEKKDWKCLKLKNWRINYNGPFFDFLRLHQQ